MEKSNKEAIQPKAQPAKAQPGRSLPVKIAMGAAVVLLAFLVGYIPSCVSARSAQEQSARLEQQLKLANLRGQLGMVSYEANRNNYANAAQFSGEFFNGLKAFMDSSRDEALKQKLQAIAARRDEITTNLAQADPAVKEKLSQMYGEFFHLTSAEQTKP